MKLDWAYEKFSDGSEFWEAEYRGYAVRIATDLGRHTIQWSVSGNSDIHSLPYPANGLHHAQSDAVAWVNERWTEMEIDSSS